MIDYKFTPAETLEEGVSNLYGILTMLRSPEGCPWDRKQDNRSITANLLDETYEYLDGVVKEDIASQREEIGDVMINAFMNLVISEEDRKFTPVEAFNEVCEKLYRRHPHVFGDVDAGDDPEAAVKVWNEQKKKEGRVYTAETFFDNISSELPPTMEAYEIQKKLAKVGFDWDDHDGILEKILEEYMEVMEALKGGDRDEIELEIGDLLFSVVNLARFLRIRPNIALHRTNEKVMDRFRKLFRICEERKIPLDKEHVKEMNDVWDEVKAAEKAHAHHHHEGCGCGCHH